MQAGRLVDGTLLFRGWPIRLKSDRPEGDSGRIEKNPIGKRF